MAQGAAIDWHEWWTFEDYRIVLDLQVFFGGASAYAGQAPTVLALRDGMDAVFSFVMINATWPPPGGAGPDPKEEAAAEAAIETASIMYEQNTIDLVLPALLKKWAPGRQVYAVSI